MCMSAKCIPPPTLPAGLPNGNVMFHLPLKLHMVVLQLPCAALLLLPSAAALLPDQVHFHGEAKHAASVAMLTQGTGSVQVDLPVVQTHLYGDAVHAVW